MLLKHDFLILKSPISKILNQQCCSDFYILVLLPVVFRSLNLEEFLERKQIPATPIREVVAFLFLTQFLLEQKRFLFECPLTHCPCAQCPSSFL